MLRYWQHLLSFILRSKNLNYKITTLSFSSGLKITYFALFMFYPSLKWHLMSIQCGFSLQWSFNVTMTRRKIYRATVTVSTGLVTWLKVIENSQHPCTLSCLLFSTFFFWASLIINLISFTFSPRLPSSPSISQTTCSLKVMLFKTSHC